VKWLARLQLALSVFKTLKEGQKKFPPLLLCPICSKRTAWITEAHVWGCDNGHRFEVKYHATQPGDKLARDYRGETEI
jgi:ribosomal protein L37AE/L43A